jgi:hypothetical protein
MKNIFLLGSIIVLMSACVKTISVEVPYPGDKLVINSLLNRDSIIYVKVSQSLRVNAYNQNISAPVGTTLTLLQNGVATGTFSQQNINGSNYFVSSIKPSFPNVYSIIASAPNFPTASATDAIPDRPIVAPLIYTPIISSSNQESKLEFNLTDIAATDDYYQLTLNGVDTNLNPTGPRFFIESYPTFFKVNTIATSSNLGLIGDDEVDEVLFTDETFRGRTLKIALTFQDYGSGSSNLNFIKVTLKKISKDAYRYYNSYNTYLNNNGNPFSEATQVFSNVQNGYGIVAGTADKSFIMKRQ